MHRKHAILAWVFAVVLFLGLVGSFLVGPGNMWSALTDKEKTGISFGERVEGSLKASLPLHETLRNWKVSVRLLSGQKEIDHIFFTQHRLIENIQVKDTAVGEKNLAAIKEFAALGKTIPYMMLLPTACSIQQELLPDNAIVFDQKSWLDKAGETMSQSLYWVDAYPTLYEARGQELYYRTDARLTQLAGYKLYTLLADQLNYNARSLSDFSIKPLAYDCYGALYARWSNGGVRADTVTAYQTLGDEAPCRVVHSDGTGILATYYTLYPESAVIRGNAIDRILGGSSPRIDIHTYKESQKSLLIFGDGYTNCLIPYLSLHYSDITLIDLSRCTEQMLSELSRQTYDQTLFACSTDTILGSDLATPLGQYQDALGKQ